ncbi:Uncharacterized protein TCM_001708 [Theobroma cacao]|uniref:Uncharacterized protein n=1 Tax=Theobroma cacao TaxID=3641 RepID=A0A061DJI8_THECC|nr:Uncharacterized protein TCM_001708 [Theobroma cacao]
MLRLRITRSVQFLAVNVPLPLTTCVSQFPSIVEAKGKVNKVKWQKSIILLLSQPDAKLGSLILNHK